MDSPQAGGLGMCDPQVRDPVIPLLLAGHEMSATALSLAWYLLSLHLDNERPRHPDLAQRSGRPSGSRPCPSQVV
jgi:cytochrome P450